MSTRTSKAAQERLPAAHRHFNLFFFFPSLSVNTSKEELVHILATAYAPGAAAAAACSGVLVVIMCCGMPSLAPRGLQHIWGCLPFLCHGLGPAQCSDQRQMPPLLQEHQGTALHVQGGASHPAHSIRGLPSPCAAASRADLGSVQPEQAAN